jgi:hypothetical protein
VSEAKAPRRAGQLARWRRAFRGEVALRDAALEAVRRARAALTHRRERSFIHRTGGALAPPRLTGDYARLAPGQLLEHFRTRTTPSMPPGLEEAGGEPFRKLLTGRSPAEAESLARAAREITEHGRWPLLGFGALDFTREPDWLRDPASGVRWPLEYHADLALVRPEGGDVRVLWELNRLGHLVTLARAFAATGDDAFAAEVFRQARHWRDSNPLGLGANWACAMEVALRSVNLLAAFRLTLRSDAFDAGTLQFFLALLAEHGAHIRRNLEYSHVRTSNHYLSDVAGLFWLGVCLPELEEARGWRDFGRRELRRELVKQVLADGADAEASTGYHRFVAELFLCSFVLARVNRIDLGAEFSERLRAMLTYARSYLRPDGRAPLVGDADGGRFLDLSRRAADEQAYLLALGAAALGDAELKPAGEAPPELLWLLGAEGLKEFDALPHAPAPASRAFEPAGTYVLRDGDLYLLLNGCGAGLGGRGSHGHNDKLSVEVSACGHVFVRDPGAYVYTADLAERGRFRSTAYHSTVEVDGAEQAETFESLPFVIGDESRPRLVRWQSDEEADLAIVEHDGYARLASGAVRHRRAVLFDRRARLWLIEDALLGEGRHAFRFRFHFAPGAEVGEALRRAGAAWAKIGGARLLVVPLAGLGGAAFEFEPRWSSIDYGAKAPSVAACWMVEASTPLVVRWGLVPVCGGEGEGERLKALAESAARAGLFGEAGAGR